MKDLKLFITTLGRLNEQITLANLSPMLKKRTALVVQHHEYEVHRINYPKQRIEALPKRIKTLGPTRQEVLEWSHKCGYEKIVMLDDDLHFYYRKDPEKWNLTTPTTRNLNSLFSWIERTLSEKIPVVGVSGREGNNYNPDEWSDNCRMMRLLAFYVPVVYEEAFFRDNVDGMNDFDVILQMLKGGYPNRVSYRYAQGHGSTQAPGGCSIMRTHETHEAGAKQMYEYHRPFVALRHKKNKTGGEFGHRTEVTVQWKEAFKWGKRHREDA